MKKKLTNFLYFTYSLYPVYIIVNIFRYLGRNISPHAHVFFSRISKRAYVMGCCIIENADVGDETRISGDQLGINTSQIRHTKIGKYCSIGPNFCTLPQGHNYKNISTYSFKQDISDIITEPIRIENDVWIGANVTVLGGVTIHDGTVVGAGSIVTKDCPPYSICVGNPAKVIKFRFTKNIIRRLLKLKWWDNNDIISKIKENNSLSALNTLKV